MYPLLNVGFDKSKDMYYVVNLFDGVVVGEFYTKVDAEDFAVAEQYNEAHRISVAYQHDHPYTVQQQHRKYHR